MNEGEINFNYFFRLIAESGYSGPVGLEYNATKEDWENELKKNRWTEWFVRIIAFFFSWPYAFDKLLSKETKIQDMIVLSVRLNGRQSKIIKKSS